MDPTATYPLCLLFGIHYPSFISEEEPAIGHLRTRFSGDTTGLVEPVQLLAVLSTNSAQFLWCELSREVVGGWGQIVLTGSEDNHEVWYDSRVDNVLDAFRTVSERQPPDFVPMPAPDSCLVSISLDDLPSDPFPGYKIEYEDVSPTRQGKWAYEMKKHLRAGRIGTQTSRERVILRKDLRRIDPSMFKGQVGSTIPETGFSSKPGRTSLQVAGQFESGVCLDIDIYWIDFIREELAEDLSSKIIASFRDTPFDADLESASKWTLDLPYFNVPIAESLAAASTRCTPSRTAAQSPRLLRTSVSAIR
ncbi:hypothetical protein [Rosistilla oblonga]|uniref:Uncharacterized protein n=1 Tax=Rosistilla oblonga TaxID=2527990 RepID=A0A518IQI9_9BACT|nr:hypothetical protein [Rosistilla oblonga]QDV55361.1 hypothetical protein Mal33_13320 [Rosistilla oblonga]